MNRTAIISTVIATTISVILSGTLAYFISIGVSDRTKREILAEVSGATDRIKLNILAEYSSKLGQMQEGSIYSAGNVLADGKLQFHLGEQPSVVHQSQGTYRINLSGLSEPPIVVATSNVGVGSGGGARVDVTAVDATGFTVEGKFWGSNVRVNTGFNFMVARAKVNMR